MSLVGSKSLKKLRKKKNEFIKKREAVEESLKNDPDALKADGEVVLGAVAKDGLALLHASKALQGDRDVVLAAVAQNGYALQFASDELKGDRKVILEAVAMNNHEFVRQQVEQENYFKEWGRTLDPKTGFFYYYNREDKTVTWEDPRKDFVVAAKNKDLQK